MSLRIKKINELIKRELGKAILKELNFQDRVLVTLTRAETSIDLGAVKVYIGVIPEEKNPEIMKILQKNVWALQQILNKKLKIKKVPKILFKEEKTTKEAEKIERILEQIKKEENRKP